VRKLNKILKFIKAGDAENARIYMCKHVEATRVARQKRLS